jgi:hypothetical protein
MKIRYLESDLSEIIKKKNSKPVIMYNMDNTIYKIYNSKKEFNKE